MAAEWTAIFERLQASGVPPPGWFTEQRRLAAAGTLDPRRAQLLRGLGQKAAAWAENFDLLHEFVGKEGHLPKKTDSKKLAEWVATQHRKCREGRLSPEHFAALESVPHWRWAADREKRWRTKFELLLRYVRVFGEIPSRDDTFEGKKIGRWVDAQRVQRKKGRLSVECITLLESISEWDWAMPREERWQVYLNLLREYVEKFGRIPAQKVVYKKVLIGSWVADQLSAKVQGKTRLTPERIAALEAIPLWRWRE